MNQGGNGTMCQFSGNEITDDCAKGGRSETLMKVGVLQKVQRLAAQIKKIKCGRDED